MARIVRFFPERESFIHPMPSAGALAMVMERMKVSSSGRGNPIPPPPGDNPESDE
jgi:hypothetical protein